MSQKKKITPIFIFSMPRSGSTLLQRILTSQNEISSASEPWILLPLLYALKKEGVAAEYGHIGVHTGVEDLIKSLPKGEVDYLESVAQFAMDVYSRASPEESVYFLDKTPRNSLVANEILKAFPEGKFIFLWRNPLAVAASIIETFGNSKWNLYRFEVDLYKGLDCLLASAKRHVSNSSKVLCIQYEDFVSNPEKTLGDMYEFLDLNVILEEGEDIGISSLKGRLGDPTGIKKYDKISKGSLNTWTATFSSPLRKRWAFNYLKRIGEDNLNFMGYSLEKLVADLQETESSQGTLLNDLVKMSYGKVYNRVNIPVLRHSMMGKRRWKYPLY